MKSIKPRFWLPIFIGLIVALAGCKKQPGTVVRQRFILDTLVTITSRDYDKLTKTDIETAVNAAFSRMRRTEKRLNMFDPSSETSRVNRSAGKKSAVKVSDDFIEALQTSRRAALLTAGTFDPAIGPLTLLWHFDRNPKIPVKKDLRRAATLVKNAEIYSKNNQVRLGRRTGLDFGGIEKGLAIDYAAEVLDKHGLKNTLITAVSSVRALGPKPGGEPWRIGIQSPRPKTTPGLIGVIKLKNGSLSTSGDYRQFFIKKGRRYHHLLDPKTGYPAKGFMSVTVVTKRSTAFADALSTGLAVMGRRRAMTLVESLDGVEVLFIDNRGHPWLSSGLRGKVKNLAKRIK